MPPFRSLVPVLVLLLAAGCSSKIDTIPVGDVRPDPPGDTVRVDSAVDVPPGIPDLPDVQLDGDFFEIPDIPVDGDVPEIKDLLETDDGSPDDCCGWDAEIVDIPDGCVPDCWAKDCGPDGCGGSCGECTQEGFACVEGFCQCPQECDGKNCGPDGCGGLCGICDVGTQCLDGVCVDCVPDCSGRSCGPDGCGALCGFCAYGQICTIEGQCQDDVCDLNCDIPGGGFKQCGPDGCGGYCGFCMGGDGCGADGLCYDTGCTGSCDGKACGLDGCGVVCGYCGEQDYCTPDGQCILNPCGDVGVKGICAGEYTLQKCVDLEVVETNCLTIDDHMCGWNEDLGEYDCIPEVPCEPSCLDGEGQPKECGTDGCWGWCGMCPTGWGCLGDSCRPGPGAECSWIDSTAGACFDHEWWFCSGDKLYGYDCFAEELKTCGYSLEFNIGQGGFGCVDL